MPIIGPNCYGLINYADGALLWPDQHGGVRLAPDTRGVGIITQSSNIACNLTMQKRGLPVAFLMTAGNQAQTGLSEMALGLVEDERVSALGLHIEGFDSVAGFERLAARARELKKPIVAMKVGRSEQARAATISHTASLAGSDAASDAFLKRLGIARVDSIPSFLEALKLLHATGPLAGRTLSSMSCSGGEASVMADSAEGRGVGFPALTREAQGQGQVDARAAGRGRQSARLSHLHLEQRAGADRDLHRDGVGRLRPQHAGARFPAQRPLLGCRLVADGQRFRGGAEDQQGSRRNRRLDDRKPAGGAMPANCSGVASCRSTALPRRSTQRRRQRSSVKLGRGLVPGSASLPRRLPPTADGCAPPSESCEEHQHADEAEAKALLAEAGLPVPPGRRAANAGEAAAAAAALGFPVALKALGIAHKSEHGAVRLNLRDEASVRDAANALSGLGTGLYVERMVTGGIAELIVGVTRDPIFGPVMTIGSGGVLVELLKDSRDAAAAGDAGRHRGGVAWPEAVSAA